VDAKHPLQLIRASDILCHDMSLLSVKCKLQPGTSQAKSFLETVNKFADACNYVLQGARAANVWNKFELQKRFYLEIRQRYGLSANLAIRALARVGKRKGKLTGGFKATSVDYDQRIMSVDLEREVISLTTVNGRVKAPMHIGNYQRHLLRTASSIQGGQLVKGKGGTWYIHVWCEFDDPAVIDPEGFLGVDLGIVNLATDSDGHQYSGSRVQSIRERRSAHKASLQSKGTKSAKRHLKKLSGKLARFMSHENHCISKAIVQNAKRTQRGIKLEELSGIRERGKAMGRSMRGKLNHWAFDQLKEQISYKSLRAGVALTLVDPRNTSRTCPECGCCEKGNRKSQSVFKCLACGYTANADVNAAENIARAVAKTPTVSIGFVEHVSATFFQGQSPRL
jgi:putative transposase